MSSNKMVRATPDQALQLSMPALMGDEVERSLVLQQRLVNDALRRSNTLLERWFPSELTKEVRAMEHEVVVAQLHTKEEVLRYCNNAYSTALAAGLDHWVTTTRADVKAETLSRLLTRREALEVTLTASWRRFCESALDEQSWAERLPPAMRQRALQKVADSVDGFCRLMTAMLREFEEFVHEHVGRR